MADLDWLERGSVIAPERIRSWRPAEVALGWPWAAAVEVATIRYRSLSSPIAPLLYEVAAIEELSRQMGNVGLAAQRLQFLVSFRLWGNQSAAEILRRRAMGLLPEWEEVEVAGADDPPPEVLAVEDPALRQRAKEAWKAATRLRKLTSQWHAWFDDLKYRGFLADPALALRLWEATRSCVLVLIYLDVNSPSFHPGCEAAVLDRFPTLPDARPRPVPWWDDADYFFENDEKVTDVFGGSRDGKIGLAGELWILRERLRTAPSTAFRPAGNIARPGDRDMPPAPTPEIRTGVPKSARGRGRPRKGDFAGDASVAAAWRTRRYSGYKDLAEELGMTPAEVNRAIDRVRKREGGSASPRRRKKTE